MLLKLLQLSVRNILRQRRRNGLMLAAIVVAVAAVVVMSSLIRGMQQDLAETAVAGLLGHVKMLAPGYRDDPGIQRSFALAEDWMSEADDGAVAGWAARVRVPAVIMSERGTRGVQFVGVDPAQEGISFLGDAEVVGEPLRGGADGRILLGRALAEQLETKVGRRLVIITQGADGLSREAGFRIAGLYEAQGEGLEKAFAFTGVDALQRMLGTRAFTEVAIRLHEEPAAAPMKERLAAHRTDLEVLDWRELAPQAAAMFLFADAAVLIWFLIMMGALVFGLVNTLVTSVMERVRELGMLRALGMRPGSVVLQVILEAGLLMLLGVAAGVASGGAVVYWLADGIDLSLWAEGVETYGMSTVLRPVALAEDVLLIVALSLSLGVVASLYPARRAVKVRLLEALGR